MFAGTNVMHITCVTQVSDQCMCIFDCKQSNNVFLSYIRLSIQNRANKYQSIFLTLFIKYSGSVNTLTLFVSYLFFLFSFSFLAKYIFAFARHLLLLLLSISPYPSRSRTAEFKWACALCIALCALFLCGCPTHNPY